MFVSIADCGDVLKRDPDSLDALALRGRAHACSSPPPRAVEQLGEALREQVAVAVALLSAWPGLAQHASCTVATESREAQAKPDRGPAHSTDASYIRYLERERERERERELSVYRRQRRFALRE